MITIEYFIPHIVLKFCNILILFPINRFFYKLYIVSEILQKICKLAYKKILIYQANI